MTSRRILVAGVILALVVWALVSNHRNGSPEISRSQTTQVKSDAGHAGNDQAGKATPDSPAAKSVSVSVPAREFVEGQPAMFAPKPGELSTDDRSPLADRLGAPNTNPEAEPGIVLDILNVYRRSCGVYPAGEDNRQIVNALLGANKEHLPFIPSDHPRLNAQGEMVDAWGTPFFFHLISRTSIEVRSAGADRRMFTDDDVVAGNPPESSSLMVAPAETGLGN